MSNQEITPPFYALGSWETENNYGATSRMHAVSKVHAAAKAYQYDSSKSYHLTHSRSAIFDQHRLHRSKSKRTKLENQNIENQKYTSKQKVKDDSQENDKVENKQTLLRMFDDGHDVKVGAVMGLLPVVLSGINYGLSFATGSMPTNSQPRMVSNHAALVQLQFGVALLMLGMGVGFGCSTDQWKKIFCSLFLTGCYFIQTLLSAGVVISSFTVCIDYKDFLLASCLIIMFLSIIFTVIYLFMTVQAYCVYQKMFRQSLETLPLVDSPQNVSSSPRDSSSIHFAPINRHFAQKAERSADQDTQAPTGILASGAASAILSDAGPSDVTFLRKAHEWHSIHTQSQPLPTSSRSPTPPPLPTPSPDPNQHQAAQSAHRDEYTGITPHAFSQNVSSSNSISPEHVSEKYVFSEKSYHSHAPSSLAEAAGNNVPNRVVQVGWSGVYTATPQPNSALLLRPKVPEHLQRHTLPSS